MPKKEEKIRLGGMALANGVLVHGPTAWACAIRTPEGKLEVASAYKRFRAAEIEQPFVRGAARLAEVMVLLPQVRRALPEARLPFERPRVLATMFGSAASATSSCSGVGSAVAMRCCSSWPGFASAVASG